MFRALALRRSRLNQLTVITICRLFEKLKLALLEDGKQRVLGVWCGGEWVLYLRSSGKNKFKRASMLNFTRTFLFANYLKIFMF